VFPNEVKQAALERATGRCEHPVQFPTYRGRCRRTFDRHGVWIAHRVDQFVPLNVINCELLCLDCFNAVRLSNPGDEFDPLD
jgi:hypothetical protein